MAAADPVLTLADEIMVVMLDDKTGLLREAFSGVAGIAIAGGILMELALQRRIDTDLNALFLVDATPTEDDLLDPVLRRIELEEADHPSRHWVARLAADRDALVEAVLRRLIRVGILKEEKRRVLWMFERRAYPDQCGVHRREAKSRILELLLGNDIPGARDVLLISLAEVSGVLDAIMSSADRQRSRGRVADIVAFEEISRSVAHVSAAMNAGNTDLWRAPR